MSGFRTHFRSFAGTALSRKSALLQVLSVCCNWSTCFSTYNTAGRRESIFSTCSPLHDRFVIKVSTQYAVNLVGILVAYLGRSAIMLLLTDCCQLLHQLLHTGFFCLRQFLPKCHPQQASSMLTLQTNFPNLGTL